MLSAIIRDLIFEQSEPQPNQRVAYMTNMSRQILGRSVVVRSQGVHSLGSPPHLSEASGLKFFTLPLVSNDPPA